ncbi:MAG: hypothetical protein A2289_03905 [Deltaproteobacteria bacterium RIFOXYA12_FULL_58_15]|nr:MAG: hypothetical protein A2289_03905 [Deltaproteobacteria bacterium RIFOXYA12_FULL_58_15]
MAEDIDPQPSTPIVIRDIDYHHQRENGHNRGNDRAHYCVLQLPSQTRNPAKSKLSDLSFCSARVFLISCRADFEPHQHSLMQLAFALRVEHLARRHVLAKR